jgi:hypothetical protein
MCVCVCVYVCVCVCCSSSGLVAVNAKPDRLFSIPLGIFLKDAEYTLTLSLTGDFSMVPGVDVLFGVGNGSSFVGALKPWRGNVEGLIGQIQQVVPGSPLMCFLRECALLLEGGAEGMHPPASPPGGWCGYERSCRAHTPMCSQSTRPQPSGSPHGLLGKHRPSRTRCVTRALSPQLGPAPRIGPAVTRASGEAGASRTEGACFEQL